MALSRARLFSSVYIQGDAATGKTHLGVYVIGKVRDEGRCARLISGPSLVQWFAHEVTAEPLLPGEVVVLDDADLHLESAQDNNQAELFIDLVERVLAVAGTLVLCGQAAWESLRCSPQAKSRLAAGMALSIGAPDESALDGILDAIAKQRGLALSEAKRAFLLRRIVRTVPGLVECVARVAEGSVDSIRASTSFGALSEALTSGRTKE